MLGIITFHTQVEHKIFGTMTDSQNAARISKPNTKIATSQLQLTTDSSYVYVHELPFVQFYASGVLDIPQCSNEKPTHSVLVTGYGELKGKKYWLVKNR